jgi:hypothetical protein
VIGTTLEASRRMRHHQRFDKDYVFEITRFILNGLSMQRPKADHALQKAWAHLLEQAPTLEWWHL